jgi:hypothetical protein
MTTTTPQRLTVSKETLEATPARAVRLIQGIGSSLLVRALLLPHGFTRADLEEGWSLLRDACGVSDAETEVDPAAAAEAVRTVDEWDERGFTIVRATISHRYPQQASFLLAGLDAAEGSAAAVGVASLLDRLDALESDPRREETRDDDLAALSLLAQRGLDQAERDRLRAHIDTVRRALGSSDGSTRTEEGNQLARLTRLRAWYDEWVAVCRVALRSELLKRVGL